MSAGDTFCGRTRGGLWSAISPALWTALCCSSLTELVTIRIQSSFEEGDPESPRKSAHSQSMCLRVHLGCPQRGQPGSFLSMNVE
ncbi:hypothetical protein HPB50_027857 [Hyalomma asiaticum]|nr:hypothetical protein HPB50_027857 [Hyalomma asiaticum]